MRYLVNFRFSHPTVDEIFSQLKEKFPGTVLFQGELGVNLLITTDLSVEEVYAWINEECPYSLRDVVQAIE